MKIEQRSTNGIKPYEQNPRQDDGALGAVAASVQESGWRQLIVVGAQGTSVPSE